MNNPFPKSLRKPSSVLLALLATQGIGTAYAIDCSQFGSGGSGSSGRNTPAECIAPILTNPRSGFDNGARLPPDQRRNDSVIQVNRADPAIVPPAPCAAGILNWTANGLNCSASAPAVFSGDAATITDSTIPNTGVASFSCSNGAWTVQPGATCNPPPPPPANCAGGVAIQWNVGGNICEGTLNATSHGANTSVTDSVPTLTGSALYSCNDGVFSYLSGSCNAPPPPASCPSVARTWTVGGVSCDGTVPFTAHNGTNTAFDSTAPTTGNAGYTCNNGALFQTASQAAANSCATAPAPGPVGCTAGTLLSWTNAATCSAPSTATTSGSTITITDAVAPATGSATYVCNNGSFNLQSSTCANAPAPAPTNCGAQNLNWTVGGQTCTATANNTNSGQTAFLSDSTGPTTGSANFTCNNGSYTPIVSSQSCNGTATPSPPPPTAPPPASPPPAPVTCNYPGGTLAWGGGQCSADPGPVSRNVGGIVDLNDGTLPNTGSIRFTCQSNGMFAPSNEVCNVSPPANQACTGRTVSWSVGSNNCSGGIQNLPDLGQATVNSSNGTPGTAGFTCSNGNYIENSGSTCQAPAPAGPVRVFGVSSSGGVGEPNEPLVDFKSGLDDLFYLHSLEIYSNGPTANPFIKFVSGHIVETQYNVGRPSYFLDLNNVEPFKSVQFTLPTNVSSPINMGDTTLNSEARFGRVRTYIMSGGCSGTSCTYTFYFGGVADRGTTRFQYGFTAQCPSGSRIPVFIGDEFGSEGTVYNTLEEPNQTCYNNNPNLDGLGTPLPCQPGDYFSDRTNACHSPVGPATNRQPYGQALKTISFTR